MDLSTKTLRTAFEAVKANQGCAGVDGVTIAVFEKKLELNLSMLANELNRNRYTPLPLLKIQVSKKNGEPRGLCIPTVRDRVAQKAVLQSIEPILEKEFEDCSYAYRKGRSVRQVVYKIRSCYQEGFRWVVDADIDDFFDNVDHHRLLIKFDEIIGDGNIRSLIRKWVKADVWDGKQIAMLEKGIPQGSPLSPILANLFLDELDETFLEKGYKYLRYADDFIVLCKNTDEAEKALALSKEKLEELLLVLDEEDIVHFDKGFKYLGVMFIKDMALTPFDAPKRIRDVLYYPPPMDIKAYLATKKGGAGIG